MPLPNSSKIHHSISVLWRRWVRRCTLTLRTDNSYGKRTRIRLHSHQSQLQGGLGEDCSQFKARGYQVEGFDELIEIYCGKLLDYLYMGYDRKYRMQYGMWPKSSKQFADRLETKVLKLGLGIGASLLSGGSSYRARTRYNSYSPSYVPLTKIGRASCRERV